MSSKYFADMKRILIIFSFLFSLVTQAQPAKYSVSNAHSHNDYEQQRPFWLAYENGFGSIEADVFLVKNDLFVAHEQKNIDTLKTLKTLYLDPLKQCVVKNKGTVYADRDKKLLLLIDCKTSGVATVNKIVNQLKSYPELIKNSSIKFVVTGNQPHKDSLFTYPDFIYFDGDLNYNYDKKNLLKIALFSTNFSNYSKWAGVNELDDSSRNNLQKVISFSHTNKRPVRFWGAPDTELAWKTFVILKADYINTDNIKGLAAFLSK